MRKSIILLCSLAFGLSGCAPATRDPILRSREERKYPSATLGTDNPESQWYRTQTIAPPSAPAPGAPSSGTPAATMPAKSMKKTATRPTSSKTAPAVSGSTGNAAL